MAQFDVYQNPNTATRKTIPYLLDVQTDLLDTLATRVVVPLIKADEMGLAAKHLNPQFKIKGEAVVMSTAELAGVSIRPLGDKVTSLKNKRDEIIAALDLLFTGILGELCSTRASLPTRQRCRKYPPCAIIRASPHQPLIYE